MLCDQGPMRAKTGRKPINIGSAANRKAFKVVHRWHEDDDFGARMKKGGTSFDHANAARTKKGSSLATGPIAKPV